MINFYVAKMRGGEALAITAVAAILAALVAFDRPVRPARKPASPYLEWLLISHIASGRTSEFLFA
ncbi:hypothetical protein [Mesorhizobium sp.]|uniref:hypothetical protein n=1 Tax=Mesorhizobium sp. TaxID=1871066 RepID=UPI000FEA6175|nr:hypothetical protein [Mesorhizobium sp.]RWE81013.1 MAG: hypothetical protein EOS49_30640 [Mesorhizobium sp.]TIX59042.1 MAG: hypothetical protein E5V28_08290 [Mesorhizobium sp.]